MIKTTVLSDNISNKSELLCEWGLSMLIEFGGRKILLDTGAGSIFARNAAALGIDLSQVDTAVLSHAHYDHGDGLETFFLENSRAKLFVSSHTRENCYHIFRRSNGADAAATDSPIPYDENGEYIKYDGIAPGLLEKYKNRIVFSGEGVTEIAENVFLVPHTTPGLEKIGEKVGQYIKLGDSYIPDDYSHEQSLVLQMAEGIVIFNSCSHGGVDNIIREAQEAFPGQKVISMVGGFHLFMFDEQEVREQAKRMAATGIRHIVTGHCTGDRQYFFLADELAKHGVQTVRTECGLVFEF